MAFVKKVEDFVCEHCSYKVIGNGYTNHCPQCLWSKHVDKDPGDRAHMCLGLMKPVAIEQKQGSTRVIHRCIICGEEKVNKIVAEDSVDAQLVVAKSQS